MNYTTWITENIPSLENASSEETYALIERAKKFTIVVLLIIRAISWLVLLQLFTPAGNLLGIQLLKGTPGWIVCISLYLLLYFSSKPLEIMLVKKKLKTLSNAA